MLVSQPAAMRRFAASVKWTPSQYREPDGLPHVVASGSPQKTLPL